MDIGDSRAEEIREIQQSLGSLDFSSSASGPTPRYSQVYEQVALLSSFGPEEFDLRAEPVRDVVNDSAVVVLDGAVRYVLNPDVRRRVLRQLGSRQQMQATLRSVDRLPADPLQVAITRIVDDEDVADDADPISWLQVAYRALSWFTGIIPTESPEAVRARIEAIGLQDRFERLVGENFQGREDELRQMREYVGVLPTSKGFVARLVQRWVSFEEKPALMITGPGGIGKSTLLAKFIVDHARLADDRRLPFAYINFDSPTVRAGDSKTILTEALRQLAIQYPEFNITIAAQRDRWQATLAELPRLTDASQRARDMELVDRFRREFVNLLTGIHIADRPLLLIFDTFEVVQERQRDDIANFYRFLRQLQRDFPALRVVISGRAGLEDRSKDSVWTAGDEASKIPTKELRLKGLDRGTSTEYLVRAGLTLEHANEVARYLMPEEAAEEGASPLSLRVAAEVWRRDLERSELDTTFWAQLRAGRIQAQLITRYVRHTDPNSTAGKLALPSLLLRRITAEALASVVAPAWSVPLANAEAERAFEELGGLISLVIERAGRALEPRPEVQHQVVDLLSDLESERVSRLHDLAVIHYSVLSDRDSLSPTDRDQARLDEIVHRLVRGDDEDVVGARWRDGCGAFVTGRIPLLHDQAQAVLDQLAGINLTKGVRKTVSRRVWELDTVERARRALDLGDLQAVLRLAAERDDWLPASELSVLVAEAHLGLGAPLEAIDVAEEAISGTDSNLPTALVGDLHRVAAEAAYKLDQPQDALNHVEDALVIAREREDPQRLAGALLLEAAVQVDRDRRAANAAVERLPEALSRIDGALSERDMLRLFGLVGEFPSLVVAAVEHGGLAYLTPTSSRQLARAITAVDEEVSARRGKRPGLVALTAGLSVGDSVTRTWQDALQKPTATVVTAVVRALGHDVPARAALVDTLARYLGDLVRNLPAVEATTVEPGGLKLHARRREALVRAIQGEFGLTELDGVVAEEFDRSLSSITALEAGDRYAVRALVDRAQAEEWLSGLIVALRNRRPSSPPLLLVANELDLSTVHFSANRLAGAVGRGDLDSVLAMLGNVESQIGRLEIGRTLVGTSLLVAPDILLVARSSVERAERLRHPADLTVRFGLKADAKGRVVDTGVSFSLAPDWLIDTIPYPGGSGFALLRVEGYPADEPLGSGPGAPFHLRRGFADISHPGDIIEGQNALICWQQAARLELHIERRAVTKAGNAFALRSLGDSSEGAPCFSRSMRFLGLLLENRAGVARIVPGADLWEALRERGHGDTVGAALS